MSKINNIQAKRQKNRSNPIPCASRDYNPTSPPPPTQSNVLTTTVAIESVGISLPKLQQFEVQENATRHQSQNVGGSSDNRGHRVTGPLTSAVNNFLDQKYLRYYGYLDGVLRVLHLHAEGTNRKILQLYVTEFLAVMKNGQDLTQFMPKNWRNGRFRSLFQMVNTFNRRRDDVDCPINDLKLVACLKPTHPRYEDAMNYMRYYQDNSIFGLICNEFHQLVHKLAKDVREYDTNILIKDHTFGYKIRKAQYDSVSQFMDAKKFDNSGVIRIAKLEQIYDRVLFESKCRDLVDLVYVDNLRVLYFDCSNYPLTQMRQTSSESVSERNLYEFVTHDYRKIGNGFFSSTESDGMELIRNNISTIECHIRPKFGKFFLKIKRLKPNTTAFTVSLTIDATKETYQQNADISTRIDSATFLGYIVDKKMVITDLMRVNEREINADLTRLEFDRDLQEPFATINATVVHLQGEHVISALSNEKCYDLILRSEYGVFRAKSLIKHRVYDKIGWFYDYIQTIGIENFDKLYRVQDEKFKRIVETIRVHLRDRIAKNVMLLNLNEGIGDYIVTMDNRFIPPLIVGIDEVSSSPRSYKNLQHLNGELYQLNKYYVLSKINDICCSIDPPDQPFFREYCDKILVYMPSVVALRTTTFARFPSEWDDEIYHGNKIDYSVYRRYEEEANGMKLVFDDETFHRMEIYQPYHHTKEENFLAELFKKKLDIEGNTLMLKGKRNRVKKPLDARNRDALGDACEKGHI